MSDTPDNVIAIETRFTEAAPVELLEQRWDACNHAHVVLDEKLRTISCRDCGEERLDPFQVLVMLSRQWRSWQREAEGLRKLNAQYQADRRTKWEQSRDRHLDPHPDHRERHFLAQADGSVVPREYVAAMEHAMRRAPGTYGYGVTMPDRDECRSCYRLILTFDSRWLVRSAPEPPPGPLTPVVGRL